MKSFLPSAPNRRIIFFLFNFLILSYFQPNGLNNIALAETNSKSASLKKNENLEYIKNFNNLVKSTLKNSVKKCKECVTSVIIIYLNDKYKIETVELIQTSGKKNVDKAIFKTLSGMQLPAPPNELRETFLQAGFKIYLDKYFLRDQIRVAPKLDIPSPYIDALKFGKKKSDTNSYLVSVKSILKDNFRPIEIVHKILSTGVHGYLESIRLVIGITINQNGKNENVVIIHSSGFKEFDSTVLKQIDAIKSFPIPPKRSLDENHKMHIAFPFAVYI